MIANLEPSPAQLAANRASAKRSTGPKTEKGKAAVRLNAVKNGLTGQTVFLPNENAALYKAHILDYEKLYQPVGPEERDLVQSVADLRWRLNRIPGLEIALMSKGRLEVSDDYPESNNADHSTMIEIHILLKYEKQFRNLQLQEARLARRCEKETAELRRLQQERKANEAAALERATQAYLLARHRNQPVDPPEIGFEFSKQRFDSHLASLTPVIKAKILQKTLANLAETLETAA